jgi:antitoxin HicB
VLTVDADDDGRVGWLAEVLDLPGCMSQGETQQEAVDRVQDAMRDWLEVAIEAGAPIPEPRDTSSYSGRFLARIPASLHARLAEIAEQEGVSLNQFVATTLAGAVGWREREST